mgnify:CR=1 FL=1
MVVSDRVLVPIDCSGFSLKGMQTLMDSINEVKDDEFNEELDILGFYLYGMTGIPVSVEA